MKILVVEDDEFTAITLKHILAEQNYAVDRVADGLAGWEMADVFEYDLILLDVNIPKLDGITLCHRLRTRGNRTPILLLTGRDDPKEKAIAINRGADDYVVKPFNVEELVARIKALLRRGEGGNLPVLRWGDLQLDPSNQQVTYDHRLLVVTPKEYTLLELFLRNGQRILSAIAIVNRGWAGEDLPGEATVRAHIKALRRKLMAVGAPFELIETVYGVGYRLNSAMITEAVPLLSDISCDFKGNSGIFGQEQRVGVVCDRNLFPLIQSLLEPEKLTVLALNGDEFLAQEDNGVDLLILEADLHPVSGFAYCRSLRQTKSGEALPIILLISALEPDTLAAVFAAGANDFVSLPLLGPELVSRVLGRIALRRCQQFL